MLSTVVSLADNARLASRNRSWVRVKPVDRETDTSSSVASSTHTNTRPNTENCRFTAFRCECGTIMTVSLRVPMKAARRQRETTGRVTAATNRPAPEAARRSAARYRSTDDCAAREPRGRAGERALTGLR